MTDLRMTRGDSKAFAFAITDASGDPLDLTGASVWMTAKEAYADTDDGATFQKTNADGITVLDAANGLIRVDLVPGDTDGLDDKRVRLLYDIQVLDADDKVTTPISGRIVVSPDVTLTTTEVS